MNTTSARPRRWATGVIALALLGSLLAACGDDTAAEPEPAATELLPALAAAITGG